MTKETKLDSKIDPIPDGYNTVTPYVVVNKDGLGIYSFMYGLA